MKRCATISLYLGLVLITILLFSGAITSSVAFAADGDVAHIYDRTDVTKDLEGSEGFDFSQYPADASKDTQIYTFLEYGYDGADNSKFGLYLYIYNPKQKAFSTSSASNKANVAVAFDEKDNASSYQRVNLIFCSATSDKLFYKFRIDDSDGKLLALAEQYAITHGGARRYDIATVELFAYGDKTATTSTIGKSYECAGYMKGFGADKDSNTHSVKAYSLDVLDIELNHTFFRPDGNSSGSVIASTKDQLNSVYFKFPNELIEYYGGIYKISTSYYALRTMPIVITSVKEVYDKLINYVGRDNYDGCEAEIFNTYVKDATWKDLQMSVLKKHFDEATAKAFENSIALTVNMQDKSYYYLPDTPIYYLFYTGNETADGSVPYAKDFSLSGERLLDYIYNYNRSYKNGKLDIKGGISKDLFCDSDDGYFNKLTQVEICADDTYSLESIVREKKWYDFLDLFNLFAEYKSESYENIRAIVPVKKSDISMPKADFCKKYLIDESAYDDVIASAKSDKETTYLFRFAQSAYLTSNALASRPDSKGYVYGSDYNYCAQETVYLDMNISSITCRKDDVYHTFAVGANPIDSVADIDAPPEKFDKTGWWKDFFATVKDWFGNNKQSLIIAAIVIVCVILLVMIISLFVKLAPYFAIKRAQSPPKPKRRSISNKTKNKSAKNAGRRKK